jgi:hypothetical protein
MTPIWPWLGWNRLLYISFTIYICSSTIQGIGRAIVLTQASFSLSHFACKLVSPKLLKGMGFNFTDLFEIINEVTSKGLLLTWIFKELWPFFKFYIIKYPGSCLLSGTEKSLAQVLQFLLLNIWHTVNKKI